MPESLGKILKRIRDSRQFSVEEVSERSRIPKNIVSAIEEDRISEIKSSFYAKSFVKTYAVFLGALNEPAVKGYLAGGAQQQKKPEPIPKPTVGEGLKPSPTASETRKIDFPAIAQYKNQILAVIAGIIAFWVLSMAVGQAGKFIKNSHVKKQDKPAVVKKEQAKKAEKKEPKDVKKETINERPDYIELEVSASDNTWLQVIGDGELMFTGAFKKGAKDTWKAKKEIKLDAGNSGVIRINVNGKPASFSGKKGEKKEIIITKDGIKN